MRKIILLLAAIPAITFGQNITNTLGTNGELVIESNANDTIVEINPANDLVVIGRRTTPKTSSSLPAGNVNFVHENGSERVNIIAARNIGFNAFPKLNLYFTPGSFAAPTIVSDGQILGIIGFGGWAPTGGWDEASGSIKCEVDGTPSGNEVPTTLTFSTTSTSGTGINAMIFNSTGEFSVAPDGVNNLHLSSAGNMEVTGAITSNAIRSVNANINVSIDDQTVVVLLVATLTLPSSSIPVGKTYTFKKGASSVYNVTINGNTNNIDSAGTFAFGGSSSLDYVTIQWDGTQWWIISNG